MKCFLFTLLLNVIFFYNVSCKFSCKSGFHGNILIVIVLDGFKEEYFHRGVTPNLLKFREKGVYIKSLKTLTFSNALQSLHTVATGYFSAKHGVIGHNVSTSGEYNRGDTTYSEKLYSFNDKILPIWTQNQFNGGISGCIMWPGCEFKYANEAVNLIMPYNSKITVLKRYEKIVEWLNSTGRPNLIMVYVDEPDRQGHTYGPNSEQVKEKIEDIDEAQGYLDEKLRMLNLHKKVHVIYLSEHGMEPVTEFIKATQYAKCVIPRQDPFRYCLNAVQQEIVILGNFSWPCHEHLQKLYQRTRTYADEFHIEANHEVESNSVYVLKKGQAWGEYMTKYTARIGVGADHPYGAHGYIYFQDRAIFMAQGYSFTKGLVNTPLQQVDFYSLFAHILRIPSKFARDGKFSRVRPLLRQSEIVNWTPILLMIVVLAIVKCLAFYVVVNYIKFDIKRLKLTSNTKTTTK